MFTEILNKIISFIKSLFGIKGERKLKILKEIYPRAGKILIRLQGVRNEKRFERSKFAIQQIVKTFRNKPINKPQIVEMISDPFRLYPTIEIDDQLLLQGMEIEYSALYDVIEELLKKKEELTKKTVDFYVQKRKENAYFICWTNAFFIAHQPEGNRLLIPTEQIKFKTENFKVYPLVDRGRGLPATEESLIALEERRETFFDFTPYDREYKIEGGFGVGGFLEI